MMHALRLYVRYAGVSVRSQLQYRAAFLMQAVGHFLITGLEFIGVWALFDRFGEVRGWTLAEVAAFYGTINITWSLADAAARGFDIFANTVKAGDFDRMLLRPRSTVLQLCGQELTLRRVGRLVQGGAVLAWGLSNAPTALSIADASLLALAVAGGVCLFVGLVILQATCAFWTPESLEVWNAFTYGGVFMSQYPLTIYRSWFRQFFTIVIPLGCICYFPVVGVLGRPDPLGSTPLMQWLAPLAGVAFLAMSLQVWKLGVRHYCSTGS
jgi:ABC-2 type transport system permease protein